jgi:isocitrate lyase
MVFTKIDAKREERDFLREVEEVKQWWTSSRFRKVKRYGLFDDGGNCRSYTAESVVAKRGTLKIEYPSNAQAKKLFALLEEHAKV